MRGEGGGGVGGKGESGWGTMRWCTLHPGGAWSSYCAACVKVVAERGGGEGVGMHRSAVGVSTVGTTSLTCTSRIHRHLINSHAN